MGKRVLFTRQGLVGDIQQRQPPRYDGRQSHSWPLLLANDEWATIAAVTGTRHFGLCLSFLAGFLDKVQGRECYSCPCCAFLKAAAASSLRPSFWYERASRKYARFI